MENDNKQEYQEYNETTEAKYLEEMVIIAKEVFLVI